MFATFRKKKHLIRTKVHKIVRLSERGGREEREREINVKSHSVTCVLFSKMKRTFNHLRTEM